jgi:hypothetical protein
MKLTVLFASLLAVLSTAGCMIETADDGSTWGDPPNDKPGIDVPGTEGHACERDQQCSSTCYCGRADRRCHTSSACYRDGDCGTGLRCDERHLCVPRDDAGTPSMTTPDAGRPMTTADAGAPADASPPPADAAPATPDASRPAPTYCRIDAQCGPGGHCASGTCQRPCTESPACGTGDACKDGFCQPSATAGGQCLYRGDCLSGSTCINGFCHPACGKDGDCPNHADACVDGLCRSDLRLIPQCMANAQCSTGRLCVDAICRSPCMTDAQCGPDCSGTVCSGGFCVMPIELEPPVCPTMPTCAPPPPGCPSTCR